MCPVCASKGLIFQGKPAAAQLKLQQNLANALPVLENKNNLEYKVEHQL